MTKASISPTVTRTITASEFEARCLKLIDEVAESGDGVVITKNGKPVAKLSPLTHSPEPSDMDLIVMYRAFSEEWWCAGWIGIPETMGDEFIKWLRKDNAAFGNRSDGWEPLDFETAALPTLRKLYEDACGPR